MSSENCEDVEELKKRCEGLEQEKADFGQKRAMFMELFKQKEDELQQARNAASEARNNLQTLQENLSKVQMELEDLKTATAISEVSKQDEIQEVREACSQQIASMQRVMEDAVKQTEQRMSVQLEQERSQWMDMKERREDEGHGFRLGPDRDGFLSSVAKTLQKKVAAATPLSGSSGIQTDQDQENLEDSMKRAQEDTEILKSVVMPLEEEITTLKEKLRDAYGRLDELEDTKLEACEPCSDEISEDRADYKEKIRDLNDSLRTEKSSRTDLEMYVAVLNTQKAVLQDDTDKLRAELKEVCKLLEVERHEHNNLKNTWQMANDQYLEGQRHMINDLRRMECVLSAEQQRQVSEMKKKDSDKEAAEKKAKLAEKQEAAKDEESTQSAVTQEQSSEPTEDQTDSALLEESLTEPPILRSPSNVSLSSFGATQESLESRLMSEDSLRASPDRNLVIPSLTEAQEKAITDPTPESEASHQMLAQVKVKSEVTVNLAGRRIVSEKEWAAMQQQVKAAREKLGKPCDMCQNYEEQLQAAQDAERKAQSQVMTAERQLQVERQAVSSQNTYTEQLEHSLKAATDQAQAQITLLVTKIDESEKYVVCMKQQLTQSHDELQDHLKTLTENREEIHKELEQLQKENDELLGRHSKHAQQMQDECINLPNNIEDLQLLLLRHREEIIQAKVSKEHTEDTLKSEILFLKDQLVSEQQEKATMEETLSQEISQLQEELATLHSYRSESERQSTLRSEADNKVKELESTLKSIQAKSKQLIGALQHQVEEQTNGKMKLETEVNRLRNKVSSLQVDLDNSEAVQRDFVKLSQSLQIQLERFRAGENDVRWQHEEDYDECVNCKQSFSVTRRKHHCRHCGKIFCADCVSKVVNSGPNLRSSRVCDVCHTMLVSEATPYFSTVPPQTPD